MILVNINVYVIEIQYSSFTKSILVARKHVVNNRQKGATTSEVFIFQYAQ